MICLTMWAGVAFNVNPTVTRFIPVGDSFTANQGNPCWVLTTTNLFLPSGFQFFTNAAHNGDYLDSSGGIMDEYPADVRVWTNSSFTQVLPLFIGANNSQLTNAGEHTNYIADYTTYVTRATNDGFKVAGITILPNWRSTNVDVGTQYEIERAACNAFILTNTICTWHINLDIDFPVSSVSGGVLFGDVPPLHPSVLGSAMIGTNVFKSLTTNALPFQPVGFR